MKKKMQGLGLEVKTFMGKSGAPYLVFRTNPGSFHVFIEVEAKGAARDCGTKEGTTHQMWARLWKRG